MQAEIAAGADQSKSPKTRDMAIQSLKHFFTLVMNGDLKMPRQRKGLIYKIKDKGKYMVFRETVSLAAPQDTPIILVVGFRLKNIKSISFLHYLFQRVCILTTPFWSGLPGYYIKLWMVDPKTKNYAGIYEWKGKENAMTYLNALIPVLHFFSIKDSVWYHVYENTELEKFLAEN